MAFLDDLGVAKLISLIKEKIQNEFAAKDDVVSDVVYEYASDGATKGFFKYKNNKRTVIVNEHTLRNDLGVPKAAYSDATDKPQMDGTTSRIGASDRYARADHVHPSDTSKADKSSTVTNVSFDSSSSKIQKTINGSTTDVVGVASQSSAGLMSASDKTKLDNFEDMPQSDGMIGKMLVVGDQVLRWSASLIKVSFYADEGESSGYGVSLRYMPDMTYGLLLTDLFGDDFGHSRILEENAHIEARFPISDHGGGNFDQIVCQLTGYYIENQYTETEKGYLIFHSIYTNGSAVYLKKITISCEKVHDGSWTVEDITDTPLGQAPSATGVSF